MFNGFLTCTYLNTNPQSLACSTVQVDCQLKFYPTFLQPVYDVLLMCAFMQSEYPHLLVWKARHAFTRRTLYVGPYTYPKTSTSQSYAWRTYTVETNNWETRADDFFLKRGEVFILEEKRKDMRHKQEIVNNVHVVYSIRNHSSDS